MMAAMIEPSNKKMPYIIRAEVEFLHPGPLLQQQLTAVEVKQHAIEAAQPPKLKIAPMMGGESIQETQTLFTSFLVFFVAFCFYNSS